MLPKSLSIYTHPKVIAVLFLGFSSGLPLVLVLSTLSIWLTEEGVSRTAIGLFAAVTSPYALKFLWSPLIDQLPLPFITKYLGRRRGWMIFTQAILALAIICLGMTDPSQNALNTAFWAFIVAVASASQDIVIDAYRVEILKKEQQGAGAAVVVFGYRIGMLVSGAGALYLADYFSWSLTYTAMAALIGIGAITVLITGEPEAEKYAKHTDYAHINGISQKIKTWILVAVFNPFANFVENKGWLVILLFIIFYKFGDAFAGVMTGPFLVEIGFSKSEIASIVKTFGLGATLVGAFIGGSMIQKFGMIKSLWICGFLQMGSNLMFVLQSYAGYNLELLAVTIAIENLSGGMGTAAFVAYLSSLCNINYTATQYAMLSSLASFGRTWLSASSGWFVDYMGWINFFLLSTAIAIPGLMMLFYLKKLNKQ